MRSTIQRRMPRSHGRTIAVLLFALTLSGCSAGLPGTIDISTHTPTGATGTTGATPQAGKTTPTPVITYSRPEVEVGVAVPSWSLHGYGATDTAYQYNIKQMQAQTGSRWVTLIFNLYEASYSSFDIGPGSITPPADNLRLGIQYAHSLGLKVYVEPVLRVGKDGWGGWLTFPDYASQERWFNAYWSALSPYVAAAQQAGAEQISLGTELQKMESADNGLWENFIAKARTAYKGQIIYGLNWNTPALKNPPAWMKDPKLFALGISAWWPINVDTSHGEPSVTSLVTFWQHSVLPGIDAFAQAVGHSIIFSEIGYRDAQDALKDPFNTTSTKPADPVLQATAYAAAAQAVFEDPHLIGILFWAWKNDLLSPSPEAVTAMHAAFTSLAA